MDEQDINIREILSQRYDESVPFGFDEKIMRKIEKKRTIIESRHETFRNIFITLLLALLFSAALLIINHFYFRINLALDINISFSRMAETFEKLSGILKSEVSFTWIIIGVNIAILLGVERILSNRLKWRENNN
jgi:hypothetical protein